MLKKDFQNFAEKYGFLTVEPHSVEGGVSKKTGKPFSTFHYMRILEYGAADSTTIYIEDNALAKFEKATAEMHYLQGINVTGVQDASGRFTATDIAVYNFDDVEN